MRQLAWILGALLVAALPSAAALGGTPDDAPSVLSAVYVVDFVATAATGIDMNDAGDVVGTSYPDPGCGPFCLPPEEVVVWRHGLRIVLPPLPGYSGVHPRAINNQGFVVGFAGFPNTTVRAVLWKPNGDSYQAVDLGVLPGTASSQAVGVDDSGRVVGWSTTVNFPPNGSPFLWTESGGMVDLSSQGFPDEIPLDMSPGGTVATATGWYRLDNPGSVAVLPPPPQGFAVGTYPAAINDAGDQARFLVNTGPQNLVYPFRFHHEGTWQMLSVTGTGHMSTYGVGSINAARDITATVAGTAVAAAGPSGLAQPLAPLLSPAYGGAGLVSGGPMNAAGQILARVMIGNSARLVKLTPAAPCSTDCAVVGGLTLTATFVPDPAEPGSCSPGSAAHNRAEATVTVTDELGMPLAGLVVTGRFLDDYWTNRTVRGITDGSGTVAFTVKGPCGVGAIAFLVDRVRAPQRTFDRTTGMLVRSVIPQ